MKKLFVVLLALCLPAWSFGQNVERQRKAEAGDASEQYYMAHCYQYGWDGAPEDAAQYAIWLEKAAASGEPGAQYDLSQLYKYGAYSVPQDDAEYLRWAKKSANNGYTPACYNLGLYYENIDREEAFYWYKMDMDLHWQEHHEEDQFTVDRLQAMGITYHPADHASSGSDRNTSSRSLTNGKSKKIISSH